MTLAQVVQRLALVKDLVSGLTVSNLKLVTSVWRTTLPLQLLGDRGLHRDLKALHCLTPT